MSKKSGCTFGVLRSAFWNSIAIYPEVNLILWEREKEQEGKNSLCAALIMLLEQLHH